MRKKQHTEPADESFEMTFIALMLLLFCFMVIMVSLAQLEGPRFRRAIGSVRGALSMLPRVSGDGMVGSGGGVGVLPKAGGLGGEDEPSPEEGAGDLETSIEKMLGEDLEGLVQVEVTESGFQIVLGSVVLFDRGEANLKPEAGPILDEVGEFLSAWRGPIEVIGHTCDLPIHTATFPSNWDLSIARAVEVVRYLEQRDLQGERLLATGMGESCPILPNTSEGNRAFNRRVEILLEYEDVSPEVESSNHSPGETASFTLGYDLLCTSAGGKPRDGGAGGGG